MKIVINGFDPFLILILAYLSTVISTWIYVLIPLVIIGWFINPRWSSKNGWKFKHE